jgi:Mg/Co/Ni transporter MgtE
VLAWSRSAPLALIMLLAMLFSMVAASAAGAAIPILLAKTGRDPATAMGALPMNDAHLVHRWTIRGEGRALAL